MSPLPSQLIWEQVICVKVFLSKLNISLVFLWSQKFIMMWTACVCDGGGCGSSSEEVQSHWLHLAAFSATPHQTNARKCEFILAQEPPAWATSVLLPATEKEKRKKTSESFEMHLQAAFIPPSASQSWPHESKLCAWIQCSFAAVCIHASALQLQALQDTSVMGSVSSIVGLLDGPADSTFPGGYLRSMMTLHLPQPALLQPQCIKGQSREEMPDVQITPSWLFSFCDSLLTW